MKRIRPHVYVAENNVGICQFYDLPKCDFCGEPARYDGETISVTQLSNNPEGV